MKKVLLATTMLVAGAGIAAADVTISGYGRLGLDYNKYVTTWDFVPATPEEASRTRVASRLRLNIDATTESDTGATFGIRLRTQYDQGDQYDGWFSAPKFWVEYEGLTTEVGNIDTPFDTVALTYATEMGIGDRSYGDVDAGGAATYYTFNSKSNPTRDYVGVGLSYTFNDVNLKAAYINPDQRYRNLPKGFREYNEAGEFSISADWTNGEFAVAAAYVDNGAGIDHNDIWFLGAAYYGPNWSVGANYYDQDVLSGFDPAGGVYNNGRDADNRNWGLANGWNNKARQTTIYGTYTFDDVTVKGYASYLKLSDRDTDFQRKPTTALGIGAEYDLGGGARVLGAVQRGFDKNTLADVGVWFDF